MGRERAVGCDLASAGSIVAKSGVAHSGSLLHVKGWCLAEGWRIGTRGVVAFRKVPLGRVFGRGGILAIWRVTVQHTYVVVDRFRDDPSRAGECLDRL